MINSELTAFRERIDQALQSQLDNLEKEISFIAKTAIHEPAFHSLRQVSAGGKRMRPFLVSKMYELCADTKSFETLETICVAVELFHIFCLIHDDVIDKADLRHNAKTIHTELLDQRYRKRGVEGAHLANSQAILIGDVLFNTVYQLFSESIVSSANQSQLLKHFSMMVQEVCVGQIIDVDLMHDDQPEPRELVTKNRLKTAYYSIVRPLQLGVLLTGQETDLDTLEKIGVEIGMMYQLQDDLLDISAASETSGKTRYTDIVQGQPTFISMYIKESYPDIYIELGRYRGTSLSNEDLIALGKLFAGTDVVGHIESKITDHVSATATHIANLQNADVREFLTEMIAYLSKRKK